MHFKDYEHFFSQPRMGRYLLAAQGDPLLARRMYRANIRIAQSFHPLLGYFEVCLRNQLNKQIGIHFGNANWILNEKRGFMSDRSLSPGFHLKSEVQRAENKLQKAGRRPSSIGVVAEQSLGFWTELFETHHYRLLKGVPIKVFPHISSGQGRKEASNALSNIRRFRNRIHHNEPICFSGRAYDLTQASQVHADIFRLSTWIDPAFAAWLTQVCGAQSMLQKSLQLQA